MEDLNHSPEIWITGGSYAPIGENREKLFASGIDGYDVYIRINNQKYKLTNKELEQYKLNK